MFGEIPPHKLNDLFRQRDKVKARRTVTPPSLFEPREIKQIPDETNHARVLARDDLIGMRTLRVRLETPAPQQVDPDADTGKRRLQFMGTIREKGRLRLVVPPPARSVRDVA